MPAIMSFTCPECQTQLRGPAELQGKKGRCKRCGHVFVLRAGAVPGARGPVPRTKPAPPAAKAPAPKRPEDSDRGEGIYGFQSEEETLASYNAPGEESSSAKGKSYSEQDRNPYGVTDLDLTPRCPFCAKEMESEEAIICVHCGYNTQTRSMGATKRTYANTGQDIFMWMLPGFGCILAIAALIGGIVYLLKFLPDPENPKLQEEWWIAFIRPAQWWGTIISLFLIFFAGSFAVKRLILHPTPPETEKK
jgi:hypothetical protein